MKTIIFDLGGVLIDWSPHRLYAPYFKSSTEIDQFLHEINFAEWNLQQDAGRPFAEGVAVLSQEFPHYAHLIRAFHERWEDSVPGAIDDTLGILKRLKRDGHPLYALTNFSAETFPLMRRRFEFLQLFEYILVSGEIGLVKPDPAIYRLMLEKVGRPAHECLFIDDSLKNIESARQMGFDVIHFQAPRHLKTELQRRNILQELP